MVKDFHVPPSRRKEMAAELANIMDGFKRESLSEVSIDILRAPINTYWFEREHSRKPSPKECRPWEFHIKYDDLSEIIYKDDREYDTAVSATRTVADFNMKHRKLRGIDVHVGA